LAFCQRNGHREFVTRLGVINRPNIIN